MKKALFVTLILLTQSLFTKGQVFEAEADVYAYLGGKTFVRNATKAEMVFSEMGTRMTINGSHIFYNPEVRVISLTRAVATYYSITNPQMKAGLIIDSKENAIMDRSNNSVYTLQK